MEIQTPNWHNEVYPYEIHLTVKCAATAHFREFCEVLGVRPLLIEMQLKDGSISEDLMCSFKQETTYERIVDKAQTLAKSFRNFGFKVIRTKIETVPWHSGVPVRMNAFDKMEKNYFEAHVGIIVPATTDEELLIDLNKVAIYCKAHKSKNLFKEYANGDSIQMYTIRNHFSLESFNRTLDYFLEVLKDLKICTERVVTEFAIYDSNVTHDIDWVGD